MQELFLDFLLEAEENVQALYGAVDSLLQNPQDEAAFKRVLRALHTLKGGFGVFQMTSAQNACHEIEDRCGREAGVHPKDFYFWLQRQAQTIEQFLQTARAHGTPADLPLSAEPYSPAAAAPSLEDEFAMVDEEVAKLFAPEPENKPAPAPVAAAPTSITTDSHVRVPLTKIDSVLGSIWEIFMARNQISYLIERSRPHLKENPALLRTWESLDSSLRRTVGELESQVMEMRMVSLNSVFQRMSRVVQQFAHDHAKQIEFQTTGEATELDKRIVDMLADPLLHLVRNAMDHGIETPEVRRGQGKTQTGHIHLSAEISGTEVLISIQDDGKGLNPEAIRKKALERGFSDAAQMTDQQVIELIFESGFSTAEKVSEISGRGVGMDAVKAQLEALSGTIEVRSTVGQGTTFLIRIPLSVSILNSLICAINGTDYAIPHGDIIEAFTTDQSELKRNGSECYFSFRGQPIRVTDLTRHFPADERAKLNVIERRVSMLIVKCEQPDQLHALLVSRISHNQEIVIKPIPPLAHTLPYISGVSILADGRPIFVLSPPKLVQRWSHVALAS